MILDLLGTQWEWLKSKEKALEQLFIEEMNQCLSGEPHQAAHQKSPHQKASLPLRFTLCREAVVTITSKFQLLSFVQIVRELP